MSYPFPDDIRNPDRQEPNPFADPLVDEERGAVEDGTADGFQATAASVDYQPKYETSYANRAILVSSLGLIGVLLSLLGWLVYADHPEVAIMPLLSLAMSIPAASIGWSNLKAIAAGAMHGDRRGLLIAGVLAGIIGVFNSVVYGLVGFWVLDLFG